MPCLTVEALFSSRGTAPPSPQPLLRARDNGSVVRRRTLSLLRAHASTLAEVLLPVRPRLRSADLQSHPSSASRRALQ